MERGFKVGTGKSIARLLLGGASGGIGGVSDVMKQGNMSDNDLYNALAKLQFQQSIQQSDPLRQAQVDYYKARTANLGRQGSKKPGLPDIYRERLSQQIPDYNKRMSEYDKSQQIEKLGEEILQENYPGTKLTRQRFEEGPTEESAAPGGLLGGMLKTAAVPLQGALDLSAGVGGALTGNEPLQAPINLAELFKRSKTEKAIPVSYPSTSAERPPMPQEIQLAEEYGPDIAGQIFEAAVKGQAKGIMEREKDLMTPPAGPSQGTLASLAMGTVKDDLDPNEVAQTMQGFGQALAPQSMEPNSVEAIKEAILPEVQGLIPSLGPNMVIIYDTQSGEAYPVDRTEVDINKDIVIYAK